MKQQQVKSYLFVSSNNRALTSSSTTNFTVPLQTALQNVVSIDLINTVIDYKAPNITAAQGNTLLFEKIVSLPDYVGTIDDLDSFPSMFSLVTALFGDGSVFAVGYTVSGTKLTVTTTSGGMVPSKRPLTASSSNLQEVLGMGQDPIIPTLAYPSGVPTLTWTFPNEPVFPETEYVPDAEESVTIKNVNNEPSEVDIPEGRYSLTTLKEVLQDVLPTGYVVKVVDGGLVFEQDLDGLADPINVSDFALKVTSLGLRSILGLTGDVTPVLTDVLRWTLPKSVKLPKPAPYLFIQSQELGNIAASAANDINFFRMLVAEPSAADEAYIVDTNTRVDSFVIPPRTIQNIDIVVALPNKTVLNNGGGSVSLLLEIVQSI
jgi:hypothetical protein